MWAYLFYFYYARILPIFVQYSLLDRAASISQPDEAQVNDMKAIAMTDHGNMFAAFNFVAEGQ